MRLSELEPKWWAEDGRHGQGVVFLCPHCKKVWLAVAFADPLDGGAPFDVGTQAQRPWRKLWAILYGDLEDPASQGRILPKGVAVVPPGVCWHRTGETFEDLTLSPSVDAGASGHWHGFVSGGAVA